MVSEKRLLSGKLDAWKATTKFQESASFPQIRLSVNLCCIEARDVILRLPGQPVLKRSNVPSSHNWDILPVFVIMSDGLSESKYSNGVRSI